MSVPILYGVGVGPGAPDLVTLRAARVLQQTPVLAFPRASPFSPSMAHAIAAPHLRAGSEQQRLFLTFPMARDPAVLLPAWDAAFAAIGERLAAKASVAFVTEGDPLLYSTFVYLMRAARARWPHVPIEVVPGVTSVTAVPAAAGAPIADGGERVAIIPAMYGVDDLPALLERFDTLFLMKIGPAMARVVDAIAAAGLLDRAVYVSRASQAGQRVVRDVREVRDTRGDCFAMIVVSRGDRSGALVGAPSIEVAS